MEIDFGPGFHAPAGRPVDTDAYERYIGRWSRLFVPALLAAAGRRSPSPLDLLGAPGRRSPPPVVRAWLPDGRLGRSAPDDRDNPPERPAPPERLAPLERLALPERPEPPDRFGAPERPEPLGRPLRADGARRFGRDDSGDIYGILGVHLFVRRPNRIFRGIRAAYSEKDSARKRQSPLRAELKRGPRQ